MASLLLLLLLLLLLRRLLLVLQMLLMLLMLLLLQLRLSVPMPLVFAADDGVAFVHGLIETPCLLFLLLLVVAVAVSLIQVPITAAIAIQTLFTKPMATIANARTARKG